MSIRPLETLLAIKVINLIPGLCPSDRRVGALLIGLPDGKLGDVIPAFNAFRLCLGCQPAQSCVPRND